MISFKRILILGVVATSLVGVIACEDDDTSTNNSNNTGTMTASSSIQSWPKTSKEVAEKVIAKYGQPQEVTSSMLMWRNNGRWKRSMVMRDTIVHLFPGPHPDLYEQVINYRVPTDKYDDLAMYDGSVIVERTKGEMSARCDKEEFNTLAINLANDVITGAKTSQEARAFYAKTVKDFKTMGISSPYLEGFVFPVQGDNSGDPDMPFE